jgi:hypothetical protein
MTILTRIGRSRGCISRALPAAFLTLAACSDPAPPPVRPLPAAAPIVSAADELLQRQMRSWEPEWRAAYIAALLQAAAALHEAGYGEEAAALFDVRIRKAPDVLTEGLADHGYEEEIILAFAAGGGDDVTERLEAALENLAGVRETAGGDAYETIRFLMSQSDEAYRAGVEYGTVRQFDAYASAYGFAGLARDLSRDMPADEARELQIELDLLVLMWPTGGPVPDSVPAPEAQIAAQISRARLALAVTP